MLLLRILSRTPLFILYLFSDLLFVVSYYLVGYRKKLVRKNLKNSFPQKSEAEIRQIEKQFYHNLCDYAVETLKLLTIQKDDLLARVKFVNPEIPQKLISEGKTVLMLASHQFNWEWLLAAGSNYFTVLDFVYQPQSSALFNAFSLAGRTRFGAYPIKRQMVGRESITRKSLVRGIALVADQFPGMGYDKKYWTTFLNQRTAFYQAISQLAVLLQCPVLFMGVRKVKRGYYEAEYELIDEPPYEKGSDRIIDNYVKATEKIIQAQPGGWLWSHNRWKDRK
ncbi:MAG: lysophospholipid acyltransferase family protein [Cyclobacteriaceae bacterium]|nr:lysophospholipid acyltransferase family protein [Cytophagales bacterium]MBX2898998.1 lysophospholipid acyltransferase family protein [Cyclobacteriaceae bacterium]